MHTGSSWSLARRILALQAIVLVVVLAALSLALLVDTDKETERTTGERVIAVANTVATFGFMALSWWIDRRTQAWKQR